MSRFFADYVLPILEPKSWPLTVRRVFLVTIPISGPAWFLLCAVLIAGLVVVLMAWAVYHHAGGWLSEAADDVRALWSEPSQ